MFSSAAHLLPVAITVSPPASAWQGFGHYREQWAAPATLEALSCLSDRADGTYLAEPLSIPDRRILNTAIGMMNQIPVDPVTPRPYRRLKRIEGKLRPKRIRNLPADNLPREKIEKERRIHKAARREGVDR
jgi:hypothetical protein